MSMLDYLDLIKSITVAEDMRHQGEELESDKEEAELRSLDAVLMYLGHEILPLATMMASKMQQKKGILKFRHLIEAITLVDDLL